MSDAAHQGPAFGVIAYLVIAFGLAWGSWSLLLPAQATGDMTKYQLLLLPGAFAPAAASFIVRRWITREGFADAGLQPHLANWRYYLIGWFLPFAVVGFIVAAAPPLGLGTPDFALRGYLAQHGVQTNLPTVLRDHIAVAAPPLTIVSSLIATPLLFGEEFGWRGYLQLRLFPGRPTLAATATGIIWGLWHWPIIARGWELPGNPVVAAAVFCCGAVLISIIFGWLRRKSGSVWCTSVAHAATNGIGGSLIVLWFPSHAHWLYVGYLGFLGWVPLGLISMSIMLREKRNTPAPAQSVPG